MTIYWLVFPVRRLRSEPIRLQQDQGEKIVAQ